MLHASEPRSDQIVAADTLIALARTMIPTMRERGEECERSRKIPDRTVEDFKAAGFIQAAQPRQFGGYNFGIDTIAKVAIEIGRGCGASAWMAGQWPGHNFMISLYGLEAQQEYWATGPDTLSSTASAIAKLNMEPERGGWRIKDSHFRFSSGCDHAQWIQYMGAHGIGLIARSDYEILDDWHVAGLRGTGSKSIIIKDAFIPPDRFIPMDKLRAGAPPGADLNDNAFQRAPFAMVVNQLLLAPAIGMARGVLDLFEDRIVKRIDLHTGKRASEGSGAQLRFAESAAEVDAAEMFLERCCATLAELGRAGRPATPLERATLRRNTTYAARLCGQAVTRLAASGDASGMFDTNPIGRMVRDLQMAVLQASLTWDEPAQTYSRLRWNAEGSISFLNG